METKLRGGLAASSEEQETKIRRNDKKANLIELFTSG
jgi:hypothetical protein